MSREVSPSSSAGDADVTAAEPPSPSEREEQKKSRNAFSELMSRKRKPDHNHQQQPEIKPTPLKRSTIFNNRDNLGAYISNPSHYPPPTTLYHNDDFVAIRDLYPKSSLHLLLLPRDPIKTRLHPFDAFEDREFLTKVQAETKKLKALAAAELRRMYSSTSAQEKARQEAMAADPPPDELPPGRDWEAEIMCGIHAHPSMNHLHIHVLSVDRYSPCLKHRKHYNSFATPFFIDVDEFPLKGDDPRRHPGREGYLRREFRCWRCGRGFGNRFARLKGHLEEEFLEWKGL